MSSNCPPQLQLSLQPNTTSFKRSFEQFGFDLESPVDGGGGGGGANNGGNDRNKRARSASSFSDSSDSMNGTLASGSNNSSPGFTTEPAATTVTTSSMEPPRLPTPEMQDVEMTAVDDFHSQQSNERYRLSLDRFNAFDRQISVLRQSQPASPAVERSATPPPTLPPLSILDDPPRLSLSTSAIPFLHPPAQPTTPLTEAFFGAESPSSTRVQSPTTVRDNSVGRDAAEAAAPFRVAYRQTLIPHRSDSASSIATLSSYNEEVDTMNGFHARLSGALDILRAQSPLVPGLGLGEQEEEDEDEGDEEEEDNDEPIATEDPPTLPPIPSVVEDLIVAPMPNPTLGDHPLPSPILRDLHSWIDERHGPTGPEADANETWNSISSEGTDPWPNLNHFMEPNVFASGSSAGNSRLRADEDAVRALDAGVFSARPSARRAAESSSAPTRTFEEMGSWERLSFELWDAPHEDSSEGHSLHAFPYSSITRRSAPSPPPRPPSPNEPRTAALRYYQLRNRTYSQTRLGSSNSLVAENAAEARRRVDRAEMIRNVYSSVDAPSSYETEVEMMFAGANPGRDGPTSSPDRLARRLSENLERVANETRARAQAERLRRAREEQLQRDEVERRLRERSRRSSLATEASNPPFILPLPFPTASWDVASSPDDSDDDAFSFGTTFGAPLPSFGTVNQQLEDRRSLLRFQSDHAQRFASRSTQPLRNRSSEQFEVQTEEFEAPTTRQWPRTDRQTREQPPPRQRRRLQLPIPSAVFDDFTLPHGSPDELGTTQANDATTSMVGARLQSSNVSSPSHGIDPQRDLFRSGILGRVPFTRNEPPSLPPPDLGGNFEADGHDASPGLASSASNSQEQHREERASLPYYMTPSQHRMPSTRTPYPYAASSSLPSGINDDTFSSSDIPNRPSPLSCPWQRLISASDPPAPLVDPISRLRMLRDLNRAELPRGPSSTSTQSLRFGDPRTVGMDRIMDGRQSTMPTRISTDGSSGTALGASSRVTDSESFANFMRGQGLYHEPMPSRLQSPVPAEDRMRNLPHATRRPASDYDLPILDPSSFTPGPFRNTMSQMMDRTRRPQPSQPSAPPIIPPLSFEGSTYRASGPISPLSQPSDSASRRNSVSSSLEEHMAGFDYRARASRMNREPEPDLPRRSFAAARANAMRNQSNNATRNTNSVNVTEQRRRSHADLHRYISQQVRMESSRLEDPDSAWVPAFGAASRGPSAAVSQIDPLRPGGSNMNRNQQLIQRDHERRRRATLLRSDPAAADNATSTFEGDTTTRRLGGSDADNMQNIIRSRRARLARYPTDALHRRPGALGDYMLDDEFDSYMYEGFLSLAETIGEAKPKSTPADILQKLEKGSYKDWQKADSDTRCPICLDDYTPDDQLLKLNNCPHWLHQDCLQQWLQTASTCPVCRESVREPSSSSSSHAPRRLHATARRGIQSRISPVFSSWYRRPPPPPPPPGAGGNGTATSRPGPDATPDWTPYRRNSGFN